MNKRTTDDELPTGMMKVSTAIDHEHLDISLDKFKEKFGDLSGQFLGHGLPNYVFWSDIEQRVNDLREGRVRR